MNPDENAYEWAMAHEVCGSVRTWLAGHTNWTLADAWRECKRGDWMMQALTHLGCLGKQIQQRISADLVKRASELEPIRQSWHNDAWVVAQAVAKDNGTAAGIRAWDMVWSKYYASIRDTERLWKAERVRYYLPELPGGDTSTKTAGI